MVREFLLPGYRRLTAFFRSHGVEIILLDTDGDCRPLIPIFVEGGITGLYPWEVTSGQNIVEVRRAFPRLQISGGLDKKALIAGPAAIDRELESKVPAMLHSGGYIPTIDHGLPADVSWDSFVYYRRKLDEIMGS
jgi:uroporphyrinogen decarboxylase